MPSEPTGAAAPVRAIPRAQRIPNQFHFVFGLKKQTEPMHLMHYLCLESCWRICRPERIFFHYCYEPWGRFWDLIRDRLTPVRVPLDSFVSAYHYPRTGISRYAYAHHSDFIRLEKLLEHGGVYADIDTLFVNPIHAALFDKACVLGREDEVEDEHTGERHKSLCNAFIMSEPGSEFCRLWLAQMKSAFDGSWSNHSTLLPQRLSEQHPERLHIEPARTFYPHMWTRAGIATLFDGCDPDFSGVVSMHLWSHLWWSRRRRDFSRFHGGRLNEAYVREQTTTYSLAARPFLPPPEDPPRSCWTRCSTQLEVVTRRLGFTT